MTRSPLYLIGDAASRRGLSRVGYFITLNGPLNGHPPSSILLEAARASTGLCVDVSSHNRVMIGPYRPKSASSKLLGMWAQNVRPTCYLQADHIIASTQNTVTNMCFIMWICVVTPEKHSRPTIKEGLLETCYKNRIQHT